MSAGFQRGIQAAQEQMFNQKANFVCQTQFSGGEVDPINFRRTDLNLYMASAQSLLNCTVNTTALVQKRNGSLIMGNVTEYVTDPDHLRLFPFIDKDGNYYAVLANFAELTSLTTLSIFDASMNFIQSIVLSGISTIERFTKVAYANVNDEVVFTQNEVFPFRLLTTYPISGTSFSAPDLVIYPYPAYDFGNIDYNNFTCSLGSTTFEFTGLSSDPGFNDQWIGGVIIGQGSSADTPLGYAIITNVAYSGGTTTFTIINQLPFSSSPPTQGSQYSIRQPAFSDELGYPGVVAYYQNRLIFGSTPTLPISIFASKINEPTDFDVGVGNDADALIYTLGNSESGPIVAINGGKQLEIYTQNYEYVCPQDQNVALTPTTLSIRLQSAFGSKGICRPISYDNDSYYISRSGNAIIQFQFEGIGLSYNSSNISLQSTHLVKNPSNRVLVRGAGGSSTQAQDNFIYFFNPDNTLTSFQFSEQFKLAALTPIAFQDDVTIIDIVGINNKLYILKYYALSEQYLMEAVTDQVGNNISLRLDASTQVSVPLDGEVTGLDNLNGYKVNVFLNQQDFGNYTVEDGTINVMNKGETGTAYVGLIYPVKITPMYVYAGANATDYYKKITRIFVDYYQSLDFFVNGKLVLYQDFLAIQHDLPLLPQSGNAEIDTVEGYNRDYTFSITQNSPFDLIISAIRYQIVADFI